MHLENIGCKLAVAKLFRCHSPFAAIFQNQLAGLTLVAPSCGEFPDWPPLELFHGAFPSPSPVTLRIATMMHKRRALRPRNSEASSPLVPGNRTSGGEQKKRKKVRSSAPSGSLDQYQDVIRPGVNPWKPDPSLTIEELFCPEVTGALRIERIFDIFGDPRQEYVDVDWFDEAGKPNLLPDPLNRPLQQSTVSEYEQRLFNSGLAHDCSGG